MKSPIDIIIIGASLGGFDAVSQVVEPLPLELPAAVVIVQHRGTDQDSRLAELLSGRCGREVVEPSHGDRIEAGHTYLAPSDYHLLIERDSFALSTEGRVTFARPSVDVTLDSAANSYGKRAAAVILTGASNDGADGARAIARAGGPVLIQQPLGAASPIAPEAAQRAVPTASAWPLNTLGEQLAMLCGMGPCT